MDFDNMRCWRVFLRRGRRAKSGGGWRGFGDAVRGAWALKNVRYWRNFCAEASERKAVEDVVDATWRARLQQGDPFEASLARDKVRKNAPFVQERPPLSGGSSNCSMLLADACWRTLLAARIRPS
jgi:hypothetical protein